MELNCDLTAAAGYTSPVQISRVLSERWFLRNGFCLACDSDELRQTAANTKACDFRCCFCDETYELKAFRHKPAKRLVDGAYSALVSRLQSDSVPTLILLERGEKWDIQALTAIHPLFLTPEVVEERKPLAPTARRAGWIGCNIRLDLMGPDAQVEIVKRGIPSPRSSVRECFRKLNRLRDVPVNSRGWTTLTLSVVRKLARQQFSLTDIYAKENAFAASYPSNYNIRAKIRQQLQVLRDLGYLEFCGGGTYRLLL